MKRLIVLLLALTLALTACAGASEPQTLKIAVLPVLDTLPLYVAEAQGYFAENNLTVELVPVSSAPERDQLVQAGQVDGMLNEVVSTLFYNQEEAQVVIVRFARLATSEYPLFRILASANSGIESVEDLLDVQIGISNGTVIEYTTDRLLENAGLASEDIQKIAVPKIPDRLALLGSGELQAANLPDPVASLAIQGGAYVVVDDTSYPEISHSVWSFRVDTVEQRPEAIKAFLAAVEQAVEDINNDKAQWTDLMVELNLVPPPLVGSYQVPDFPTAGVPSESQFNDALRWAQDQGLIEGDLAYGDSIDASFLP